MPTEEKILAKKENDKTWLDFQMDLDYPAALHKDHSGYPLAHEEKKIKKELISEHQKKLEDELQLDLNEEKLERTLQDKKNYVVHYRNLQLYLKLRMKLKKVHRTLEFDEECLRHEW